MRSPANDYSLPQHPRRAALRGAPRPDAEHPRATPSRSATIRRRKRCRCGGSAPFLPGEGGWGGSAVALERPIPGGGPTWSSRLRSMYEGALRQGLHPGRHDDPGLGASPMRSSSPITISSNIRRRSPARPATCAARSSRAANPFEAPRARATIRLPPLTPIPGEPDVQRGGPPTTAIIRSPRPSANASARLHQSGRLEIRRLSVLRLLPALRLRGECQRLARTSL